MCFLFYWPPTMCSTEAGMVLLHSALPLPFQSPIYSLLYRFFQSSESAFKCVHIPYHIIFYFCQPATFSRINWYCRHNFLPLKLWPVCSHKATISLCSTVGHIVAVSFQSVSSVDHHCWLLDHRAHSGTSDQWLTSSGLGLNWGLAHVVYVFCPSAHLQPYYHL